MFKNALISVSNKDGLAEFLRPHADKGLRIVSSGGTAKHLKEKGFKVIEVNEQTGFPEVMDGRVKTLHPKIHMALLARTGVEEDAALLKKEGIEPFDLVIVNLYPFEAALRNQVSEHEQVEYIDIGGPSLLRAASKSYDRIAVVCDPTDYKWINEKGELSLADKRRLAAKVFSHTAAYDAMIARFFAGEDLYNDFALGGRWVQELRYGENAQQKAAWFRNPIEKGGLHEAKIIQGKALSFNNLLDLEAASGTVRELEGTAVVGVKHNNPCGAAIGKNIGEAVRRAVQSDPVSIFGGIVAANTTIDGEAAEELGKIFLECVVAPSYTDDALKVFEKKKNLRILEWPGLKSAATAWEVRTVSGGFLVQTPDNIEGWISTWKVLGETPSDEIKRDLVFAWKVCGRLKSNAIALAKNGQTIGLGMGQVNRVDAVEHAIERWKKHSSSIKDAVLASDAFFPFPDSIEVAARAGVKWVIQPGGSVKDEEVFAKAKELGINMVLTGVRHFRH